MSETTLELFGEEGSMCDDCYHDLCYHCDMDAADGLVAGCQIVGCKCKAVWRGRSEREKGT